MHIDTSDDIFIVIVTASAMEKNMKLYPPMPPKMNIFFKPKPEQICISKIMKATFYLIFITLSLNFGAAKSDSCVVNFFVKLFCVLKTLGMGLYITLYYIIPLGDPVMMFWYFLSIAEFFALVFVLLFSKRTTFVEFYEELLPFDAEMSQNISYRPEFIIISGLTLSLLYRSLLSLTYCTLFDDYCISPITALIIFDMFLLGSDAFLIVYFTIYYTLYCRIKNFTKLMKNETASVLSKIFLYKSISDVYDRVKILYNPLYVVLLVIHTVDMMITIFYPLLQMDQRKTSTVGIVAANISVIQEFLLLFAPAFASGLLTSQVEKLRLVLMNKALREREEKHTKVIERFIRYIEARPMKTVIFKIISLDWKLPVSVVHICVTYLIVMLQFTHKY